MITQISVLDNTQVLQCLRQQFLQLKNLIFLIEKFDRKFKSFREEVDVSVFYPDTYEQKMASLFEEQKNSFFKSSEKLIKRVQEVMARALESRISKKVFGEFCESTKMSSYKNISLVLSDLTHFTNHSKGKKRFLKELEQYSNMITRSNPIEKITESLTQISIKGRIKKIGNVEFSKNKKLRQFKIKKIQENVKIPIEVLVKRTSIELAIFKFHRCTGLICKKYTN